MNIFNRKEKEDMRVPRSVQEAIPIQKLYFDGTFYLGKNKYSNTYKFTDINYQVANKSDKEDMFLSYSELLNSLDSNQDSKITIINRKLNKNDFAKTMLMKPSRDGLNKYRNEYNKMITDKAENSNERNLIFCRENGDLVNRSMVNAELRRICEKMGIKKFSMHAFRHTFATRCVEAGLNFKAIQGFLGHSNITTTLDIYADFQDDFKREEMLKYERYMKEQ